MATPIPAKAVLEFTPRPRTLPFRRRSIVVSKAKRMVDVSLALFARFAGNCRISDLLSMLT